MKNVHKGEIRERMSATAIKNTEIFKVEIKDEDPKMATRIANKIARASLQELPIYIEGSSVKIIDYASVPKAPTSPNIVLNTAMNFI